MNNKKRCSWSGEDPLYIEYHDSEWGKPIIDDRKLFEFLVLESAQAGLSWITILRKRENYRKNFADFDPKKIASFTKEDVEILMKEPGIIRNRKKIEATISNANVFLAIQKEWGSFYSYLYSFLPDQKIIVNSFKTASEVPAETEISTKLSKDLKKKGIKFFGPVICYAFMQATGMVNDHLITCDFRSHSS